MKLWDILAPHFTELPSTATRLRGPWSAAGWSVAELVAIAAVSLLRIPGLSVAPKKFGLLVPVVILWNVVCWFLADVSGLVGLQRARRELDYGVITMAAAAFEDGDTDRSRWHLCRKCRYLVSVVGG